jgi:hypothetical protein
MVGDEKNQKSKIKNQKDSRRDGVPTNIVPTNAEKNHLCGRGVSPE